MLKALAGTIENDTDLYLKTFTGASAHGIVFLKPARNEADGNGEEKAPVNAYAVQYTQSDGKQSAALLLPDGALSVNMNGSGIRNTSAVFTGKL